jgi:hypothetical protein
MKKMCVRTAWRALGALSLLALLVACSSKPAEKEPIMTVDEFERNTPEPDDPCVQGSGEPHECETNDDCCKGMVCTRDPSRSHVKRYCLDG